MGMDVRQCRRCDKLFQSLGKDICFDCIEEMDNEYVIVRDYIYENPSAGIVEISKETGVAEKMILHFLREKRLSLAEASILLTCESCGKAIATGRYCDSCLGHFDRELNKVAPPPKKTTEEKPGKTEGMHLRYKG